MIATHNLCDERGLLLAQVVHVQRQLFLHCAHVPFLPTLLQPLFQTRRGFHAVGMLCRRTVCNAQCRATSFLNALLGVPLTYPVFNDNPNVGNAQSAIISV